MPHRRTNLEKNSLRGNKGTSRRLKNHGAILTHEPQIPTSPMWFDCIFIEFLVIFGINLFLNITVTLSIIKDDLLAVKAAGRSDNNPARAAALRIYLTKHWLVRISKINISCYKRLYRLDLNKQLWREFWVNQQRSWKIKGWINS